MMDRSQSDFLRQRLIFACIFGSRAHGAETNRSDVDVRGVFSSTRDDLLSDLSRESVEAQGDSVFHEIRRFMNMVVSANPNILEVLFAPPHAQLFVHPAWQIVQNAAPRLLSQKVAVTYNGWCKAEMARMDKMAVAAQNDERVAYKYRKAAAHALRLMRIADEVLRTGEFHVFRHDARDFLAIKNGERPTSDAIAEAVALGESLKSLKAVSRLPIETDANLVRHLIISVMKEFHSVPPLQISPMLCRMIGMPDSEPTNFQAACQGRMICLDLECAGHSGKNCRDIIEIGGLELIGGVPTGVQFHTYLRSDNPPTEWTQKIHGLNWEHIRNAPLFEDVWPNLRSFIGASPIVCHGADSDRAMLMHDIAATRSSPFLGEVFCSAKIAARLFADHRPTISLDEACLKMGLPGRRGEYHNAVEDAALLASMIPIMNRMARDMDIPFRPHQAKAPVSKKKWIYRFSQENAELTAFDGEQTLCVSVPDYPSDTHEICIDTNKGRISILNRTTGVSENPSGPHTIYHSRAGVFRTVQSSTIDLTEVEESENLLPGLR
jgi:DNA polymerase III epsilon subunit-like protein